jgi:hypothetical protein
MRVIFIVTIPILVIVGVYLPVIENQFVWDDYIYIDKKPADIYFHYLFTQGTEPFSFSRNHFRPIPYATFWIDHALGGQNPAQYHLTNLAFHLLNTLLLGFLVSRWLLLMQAPAASVRAWLTPMAMLFYGLHPALIETVSWISCRFDLLTAFFLLLALHADLRMRGATRNMALIMLFTCALLSKETAIGIAAAWPCWLIGKHYATPDPDQSGQYSTLRRQTWLTIVFDCLLFVTGVLIVAALRYIVRNEVWVMQELPWPSAGEHLYLVVASLSHYLNSAFFPIGSTGTVHRIEHFESVSFLYFGLVITLTSLSLWVKGRNGIWLVTGWLLLASVLAFIPTMNILPIPLPEGIYTADRYLTYPLVFATLALGTAAVSLTGLFASHRLRYLVGVLVLSWFVACAALIRGTIPLWYNDVSYWGWMSMESPGFFLAEKNLASGLLDIGQIARAAEILEALYERNPDDVVVIRNLASAYRARGNLENARAVLMQGLTRQPGAVSLWHESALVLMQAGDHQGAAEILSEIVLVHEHTAKNAHLDYIRALMGEGRVTDAKRHLERATAEGILLGPWRIQAEVLLAPK